MRLMSRMKNSLKTKIVIAKMKRKLDRNLESSVEIAEVVSLKIENEKGEEITEIEHGEKVKLTLTYFVNDTTIKKPVVGLALLRLDNLYVCGLNTLLDKIDVPWEKKDTIQLL